MQVKISFTVDIEEVPVRVGKQLTECMHDLTEVIDSDIGELTSENAFRKIQWIESIRKKLLRVDTKLADCYSILVGYNKAIADSLVAEQNEESQSERQVDYAATDT